MTQYQEVLFICATIQRDNGTYELGQVIASLIAFIHEGDSFISLFMMSWEKSELP